MNKDFWWSMFSVTAVLGILAVFLYLGPVNNPESSQRIEPGVGAGPGETTISPAPTPTPTQSSSPTPTPTPEGGENIWPS